MMRKHLISQRLAAPLALALILGCEAGRKGLGQGDDPGDKGDMSSMPPSNECGVVEYQAMQAPAAMMVVLDRSSSMAGNKWATAVRAIVQALDQPVFDSMHVGLYVAPSGNVKGPMCLLGGLIPVACQAPIFPQIELRLAGTARSTDAVGVRREIKTWLNANQPDNGEGDASPLYQALETAIESLKEWKGGNKRLLFVVTDGTLSCNSFSTRPGFADCNGCERDWEDPNNLVSLLKKANTDASQPVETFILGVPGADTYDPTGCSYPPYRMRLALSAIAYAGAPAFVPAECTGRTFTQNGANPQKSCHFDLTQGGFDAQKVADAISRVRGQVLGCTYELPVPEDGKTVDKDQVNVKYTLSDLPPVKLFRRKDKANTCAEEGCWDYTPDGKVELVGKACSEVKSGKDVRVRIVVGCATVLG